MPTQTPLHIEAERGADRVIAKVRGSATMDTCDRLREGLSELVREAVPLMVLDLSELDFICSDGLGVLISAYHECRRRGGQVRLASPTPPILRLLDITKLGKVLPIFPSVEAALGAPLSRSD